ncbi:hypothetical protein ACMFMG_001782 [Clarireedia jacksonii]
MSRTDAVPSRAAERGASGGLNRTLKRSEKGLNTSLEESGSDRSDIQGRGSLVEKPGRRLAVNKKPVNDLEHLPIDRPESKRSMEKPEESRRSMDNIESIQSVDRQEPRAADRSNRSTEQRSAEQRSVNISEKRSHGSQSTCVVVSKGTERQKELSKELQGSSAVASRHTKGTERQQEPPKEKKMQVLVFELGGLEKTKVIRDILNNEREKEMERLKIGILHQEEGITFSSNEAGKMYSLLLEEHKDAFRHCNTFIIEECLKQSCAKPKRWSEKSHSDWQKGRAGYVERLKTILGQKNQVFEEWTFEDLPPEWVRIKDINLCTKAELEAPEKKKKSDTSHGRSRNRRRDGRASI